LPVADEVVDDQHRCARHITDEKISGDNTGTAMFVHKSLADGQGNRI
jgi:hypothetical protein